MEIKCPTCAAALKVEEDQPAFDCPACGAPLEVVVNEHGFTIVGVRKADHPPEARPGENDLLVGECRKWQMRALFSIGAGIAAGMMLFLHLKNAYLISGIDFWRDKGNIIPIPFFLLFTILPAAVGGWVYRYYGRRAAGYLVMKDPDDDRHDKKGDV